MKERKTKEEKKNKRDKRAKKEILLTNKAKRRTVKKTTEKSKEN